MPVSPDTAYNLLKTFGLLEFQLKQSCEFFQTKRRKAIAIKSFRIGRFEIELRRRASSAPSPIYVVDVDWNKVDIAAARMGPAFVALVPRRAQLKFLSPPRNRPKKEEVQLDPMGRPRATHQHAKLPPNDAAALVVAMRRVRNNLFHGGKEDPLEESYPGEDDDWAVAATAVAQVLLNLLERNQLRP